MIIYYKEYRQNNMAPFSNQSQLFGNCYYYYHSYTLKRILGTTHFFLRKIKEHFHKIQPYQLKIH